MRNFLLSGVLLIGLVSFGQQRLLNEFGNEFYSPNLYFKKYGAPDGSPYLNDEFLPAGINDIKETQLVRFDAFEGRVEVKLSPDRVVILDSEIYYLIRLKDGSGRIFETLRYDNSKGISKFSFFERLHQGENYELYRREVAKFYKKEKAQGYQEAKPARFKLSDPIFYIKESSDTSGSLKEIPKKQKDFKQSFPDNDKKIKDLVKKENLKLDEPDDLIRIYNVYYSKS